MLKHAHEAGRQWLAALAALALLPLVAAAADLASWQHGAVLRVGTTGDYAPFSVAQGESLAGLDVDLMTRLAHDLGATVRFVRFRWPDLSDDLAQGKFDVVASGVTVRPERALVGRYTRPYANTGAVALVRTEDAARLTDRAAIDRTGVRIAVNRGGHLEQVARRLFPRATIEPVSDNSELPGRVLVGRADVALSDSAEARAWQRPELRTVGPFTRDRKALLVRKDAPELGQWIDTWLRDRERDGWLGARRKQWLGDAMFAAAGADREAVLCDIELRCQLMPMVAASKRASGVPIADPAQEQRVLDRVQVTARTTGIDAGEVARLFSALIRAAKAIQEASGTDPHAPAPPLDQLRSAISDIDTHLIRQLHFAARTVKPSEWRAGVREGVQVDNLSDALKADIAESLAHTRTLITPGLSEMPKSKRPTAPGK
jgi:cyclohexadienyl dehydratase